MELTERLSMPLLSAGQAQKELFHNEALQLLDMAVAAAVETPPQDDPPAGPAEGRGPAISSATRRRVTKRNSRLILRDMVPRGGVLLRQDPEWPFS